MKLLNFNFLQPSTLGCSRLTCEKIFEGAEGNLKRLLGKSRTLFGGGEERPNQTQGPAQHQKRFLHTVLTLTTCFINNRSTEEVARVRDTYSCVLKVYVDNIADCSLFFTALCATESKECL